MPRIPLQVLVLPFRQGADGMIEYAIFRRSDYAEARPSLKTTISRKKPRAESGLPGSARVVSART
jgi:hypothetical protein